MTVPAERRVPNRMLRAVRLALQMSQSEFAAAIRHAGDALGEPNTANKRLIQKWESGEHTTCRSNYRRALQSVTQLPYQQLGFSSEPASLPGVIAPASRIGTPLEVAARVQDAEPSACEQACTRLRFALERPGQADVEAITLVETATLQLFDLEHHQPAAALQPAVRRHIEDIAALLSGTHREHLRHRLARTGGHAAALIGYLAFDQEDPTGAYRAWDAALAAAKRCGDGPLLACVLTYQSYTAADRGDPATAWQLAHTAVAHAGTEPRARAWMAARAAEEAARLGEKRAALAELDLAMQVGSSLYPPTPDDPAPPWTRFFYRSVLGAMAANVHSHLGNIPQSRDAAAWALRTLGEEQVKTRAHILAEVACATARAGELELAIESAHHAADLAERLQVTLAHRRLRILIPLLAPHTTSVAVRELLTRLAPALTPPHPPAALSAAPKAALNGVERLT